MRNGFFGSLIILVVNAGLVLSEEPRSPGPEPAPGEVVVVVDIQAQPLLENGNVPGCVQEPSFFGEERDRFWASAEFLLWRIKDGHVPPLVTTSPPNSSGVLGAADTTTLFGGNLDYHDRYGVRFTVGTWLDSDCALGIEGSYFFLDGNSKRFGASSTGAADSAVLNRPFLNVITGLPDIQLLAVPGLVPGSVQISSSSNLQGAEANLPWNLCCHKNCCCTECCVPSGYRVDLITGARYLRLDEGLGITENLSFLPTVPPPFVPGSTISVADHFQTRNTFYGGQLGARAEWWRGRFFVNVLGKVALGDTHQEVNVNGATVFTDPSGMTVRQSGGLLALPTNIGSRSRDEFSVVPEIAINVGYQVTDHLRAFVGYSFLYWSSVVRPGDQIDFGVNPTQLPSASGPGTLVGPARPAPLLRDTDFWAQGVNFGVEFRW